MNGILFKRKVRREQWKIETKEIHAWREGKLSLGLRIHGTSLPSMGLTLKKCLLVER